MKTLMNLILAVILSNITFLSFAGNLTIFSEDAQAFTVTLNGKKYNETPESNVVVENLPIGKYRLYVHFENTSLAPVTRNIEVIETYSYLYAIRKNTNGTYFAHLYNQIQKTNSTTVIADTATEEEFTNEETDFAFNETSGASDSTSYTQEDEQVSYEDSEQGNYEETTDSEYGYEKEDSEVSNKKELARGQFTLLTINFKKKKRKKGKK